MKEIEKNDLKIIEEISKKYNVSKTELALEVIRLDRKIKRIWLILELKMFEKLERTATEKTLSKSQVIEEIIRDFVNDNTIIDKSEIVRWNKNSISGATKKISISLHPDKYYLQLWELSNEYCIEMSSLIRYAMGKYLT